MKVYILQCWEYSSYSYNGLVEGEKLVFASEESAIKFAVGNKWNVVEYPDKDSDVTIDGYDVQD